MVKGKQTTWRRLLAAGMVTSLLLSAAWPAFGAANDVPSQLDASDADAEAEVISFTDVSGHYAQEAVERLASLQLLKGSADKRFQPQQPITRQDFAVLLAKTTGIQPVDPKKSTYQDIETDGADAPYVIGLARSGIMQGRSSEQFGASEPLTRQELAVILARFLELTGSRSDQDPAAGQATAVHYQDEDQIADYAEDAVDTVTRKKWMTGSANQFRPLARVTRAEAAVIADRVLAERVSQAENVVFSVNADKLTLAAGTSERLKVTAPGGSRLPFTPIFSFDRPEIGTIEPDGTFIAGPAAGKGQITVSVGYKTMMIPVEVTADGTPVAEEGDEAKAEESDEAKTEESYEAIADDTAEAPAVREGLTNFAPKSFFGVKTTGPSDTYFHSLEMNYPGPVGGLVTPSETWTGYARQFGREITLTLPDTKSVERVSVNFRQEKKMGILMPTKMEVEVSRDGKAWHYAGRVTHGVAPTDETPVVRTLSVSLPEVEARYVRVRFPVQIFVFARQLEVWGTDVKVDEDADPLLFAPIPITAAIVDKKAEDRMQNLLLAYSGAHGERGTWTKADFLPLVGYIDTDGKVRDRMFDAVLFLPYPVMPTTKAGWEAYLDDVFRPGRQLDALNEAMKEYNKQRGKLYIDPEIEKVVLTLPYPNPSATDFGRVHENEVSLSFAASQGEEERAFRHRKKALEWYFQELLQRFEKAEYKYLKLEGIYWWHELVEDSVPGERQLIRETADMVHEQALRFYWIPYFGATGLGEWKDLGFDYAFVQPNFYSDKQIPVDRIEAALAVADRYGMGIEIEGDERMVRDVRYYQLYYNQLIAGHKAGIDKNKVHAYYYGSKSLLEAVNHKEPQARAVYDDTYLWMRGRFNITEYLQEPQITPTPTQTPAPATNQTQQAAEQKK